MIVDYVGETLQQGVQHYQLPKSQEPRDTDVASRRWERGEEGNVGAYMWKLVVVVFGGPKKGMIP